MVIGIPTLVDGLVTHIGNLRYLLCSLENDLEHLQELLPVFPKLFLNLFGVGVGDELLHVHTVRRRELLLDDSHLFLAHAPRINQFLHHVSVVSTASKAGRGGTAAAAGGAGEGGRSACVSGGGERAAAREKQVQEVGES